MDILEKIVAERMLEVERLRATMPPDELQSNVPAGPRYDFAHALRGDGVRIIAEIKQRSPSKGQLTRHFDPIAQAASYRSGGAAAISVLTEQKHFGGKHEYLELAKRTAQLPVLCKDFIVDPYQVHYARYMNADAILLIVRILTPKVLKQLLSISTELHLDALVEAHNEDEIKVAVDCGARIVGVNSRDLSTFEVDTDRTARLAALIPDSVTKVAESGVKRVDDIRKLRDAGFGVFLVGEALMCSSDPAGLLESLRTA